MANTRQVDISVLATQVPSDQTGMPVLLTRDNFPDEMLDPVGANRAKSDGGDLRAYANNNQTGRYDIDIESFEYDSVLGAGDANIQVWILNTAETFSSLTDTPVYFEYGDNSLTQPAVGDPFGRNATWQDSSFRTHMSATTPVDVTGNNSGFTSNAVSLTTGPFGDALAFNGSTSDIDLGAAIMPGGDYKIAYWVQPLSLGGFQGAIGDWVSSGPADRAYIGFNSTLPNWDNYSTSTSTFGAVANNNWYYIVVQRTGTTVERYINGVAQTSATDTGVPTAVRNTWIGALNNGASFFFNGDIAEIEFGTRDNSDRPIVEFNNQNSPSTFWSTGTPIPIGGGGTVIPVIVNSYRQRRVY